MQRVYIASYNYDLWRRVARVSEVIVCTGNFCENFAYADSFLYILLNMQKKTWKLARITGHTKNQDAYLEFIKLRDSIQYNNYKLMWASYSYIRTLMKKILTWR